MFVYHFLDVLFVLPLEENDNGLLKCRRTKFPQVILNFSCPLFYINCNGKALWLCLLTAICLVTQEKYIMFKLQKVENKYLV